MADWRTPADEVEQKPAVVEVLDPVVSDDDDEATPGVELDAFGRALAPSWVRDAEPEDLTRILEAVCFSLNRPVTIAECAAILGCSAAVATRAVDLLTVELRERGLMLQRHQDEFQLVTRPAAAWAVQRALNPERPGRLSKPALETLAIVAYRQPVTRTTLEGIRGVNCDAVLESLERRGLVAEVGYQDTPGHPRTFGTTLRFLQIVGLERIEDLPQLPDGFVIPDLDASVWAELPGDDDEEDEDDELIEDEAEIIAQDDAVAVVHHESEIGADDVGDPVS